jgi:hypothetical protein
MDSQFHQFLVIRTIGCTLFASGFAYGCWYYARQTREYGLAAFLATAAVGMIALALHVH